MSKKTIIITLVILFPVILLSLSKLFMLSSTVTCAKITSEITIHGAKYIQFEYYVNGKRYEDGESVQYFKIRDLDSLRKIECVRIRYSNFLNSHSEIIDVNVSK